MPPTEATNLFATPRERCLNSSSLETVSMNESTCREKIGRLFEFIKSSSQTQFSSYNESGKSERGPEEGGVCGRRELSADVLLQ